MSRPRSHTLFEIVNRALRETRLTEGPYATDVMREYERTVDPMHRRVQFHSGGKDPYKDLKLNAQLVKRFLTSETKWDGDLEEAFVAALPEPYRREALEALAARYGLMAVEKPVEPSQAQRHVSTGAVARESGEALVALAPLLEDGVIDAKDQRHAAQAIKELHDVIAACTSLIATIEKATSGRGPVKAVR